MEVKLAVVGSRGFDDYRLMMSEIYAFTLSHNVSHIVSGGASGADSLAERCARKLKIPMIIHRAEWQRDGVYDNAAGIKRNKLIIDDADVVYAFWDSVSTGTKHSISLAKKQGKPLKVIYYENNFLDGF